jgi:hypothetical protein
MLKLTLKIQNGDAIDANSIWSVQVGKQQVQNVGGRK